MFRHLFFWLAVAVVSVSFPAMAQAQTGDKAVRVGHLPDGLTYYLCHNERPRHRADFYIVQRVGSILENDNQRGLAHFLEHMAFHDTKHFPNNSIISFLEKNGVKFGTNLNAETGIDQTVYNICNVPSARQSLVDSCLLILHDWSGYITLKDKDIDDERRVIREEWRTRNNATLRMYDQLLPQVYPKGCRYAERMPIGLMSIIDTFKYQTLRDYYYKWYHPDLQAIVVVGDIDVDRVEQEITRLWADIPRRSQVAERVYYTVPSHNGPVYGIADDPESESNSIQILFNTPSPMRNGRPAATSYRDKFFHAVVPIMLNARIDEKSTRKDVPYLNAAVLDGDFLVSSVEHSFGLGAGFVSGAWQPATQCLVDMLHSVRDYGFVTTEYERACSQLQTSLDDMRLNADRRKNAEIVSSCVANFLRGEPLATPGDYADSLTHLVNTVGLKEVNEWTKRQFSNPNQVVLYMGIRQKAVPTPTREAIDSLYRQAWTRPVTAYTDSSSLKPLMAEKDVPAGGRIVSRTEDKALGTTTLTLQNGARIIIKPTDFRKNQISMRAYSPGGNSLYDDNEAPTFGSVNQVAGLGGLGSHSALELTRLMMGKNARVSFDVSTFDENLYGSCSPKYLETMLQEVYLVFQGSRKDFDAFQNWKRQVRPAMQTRDGSIETQWQDSVAKVLYNNNVRFRQFKTSMLDRVNYRRVLQMFNERYSNASDFTFVFVGNIDMERDVPQLVRYIGSLPSTGKKEKCREVIPYMPKGNIVCHFSRKMENPKTNIMLTWVGKMKYNMHNRMLLNILHQALEMIYTNTLRGEEGGTYGALTDYDLSTHPKGQFTIRVEFETNNRQADTMLEKAKQGLRDVAENGISQEMFDKIVTYMTKRHNDLLKENAYWLEVIQNKIEHGDDDYSHYFDDLNAITPADIQQCAKLVVNAPTKIELMMKGE